MNKQNFAAVDPFAVSDKMVDALTRLTVFREVTLSVEFDASTIVELIDLGCATLKEINQEYRLEIYIPKPDLIELMEPYIQLSAMFRKVFDFVSTQKYDPPMFDLLMHINQQIGRGLGRNWQHYKIFKEHHPNSSPKDMLYPHF